MRKTFVAAVAAALAMALAVPAMAGKPSWAEAAKPGNESIVEIATTSQYAADLEVLVTAVSHLGLVPMLSGNGAFTVFAPTDAAFENSFGADEDTIKNLITSGALDDVLGDIVGYHVANGRRTSNSVLAAKSYQMLNGDKLTQGELVDAGLLSAPVLVDLSASNGVIHVLTDHVLMP